MLVQSRAHGTPVAATLDGDDVVFASPQPRVSPGQVVAFVGGKGGVGTTTLAVNVATVLARGGASSTLLIDLHVAYGDAALFVGAEPRFSVADALENIQRLDDTFLRTLVGRDTRQVVHRLERGEGRFRILVMRQSVLSEPQFGACGSIAARSCSADHGSDNSTSTSSSLPAMPTAKAEGKFIRGFG